jgi:hypothetical protein
VKSVIRSISKFRPRRLRQTPAISTAVSVGNDQEGASILPGRDEGGGTVKTILDQTTPGFAPDTRLKFANQIVDALLDKSVPAQLSRRRTVRKINCSRNPRSSMQSCGCQRRAFCNRRPSASTPFSEDGDDGADVVAQRDG